MSASNSPHRRASLKRVEGKVDSAASDVAELRSEVGSLRGEVSGLSSRVNGLNLNGSASALKSLADHSPALLKLAEVAPRLVDAVEREAENAAAWRAIKRWFNPLRPLGAAIWALLVAIAGAAIVNHI